MAKYRKKPVVIEALKWTGKNLKEIQEFCTYSKYEDVEIGFNAPPMTEKRLIIITLEGLMNADKGDFIIKGVKGEFYPCKPDIFELTYELIKDKTDGHE